MLRIKHHEFWNTHLFHFPVYLYWLFLAFKARSLFFFSGANPGIETGGLIGESKYRILKKIDPEFLSVTLFFSQPLSLQSTMETVRFSAIRFPFVVKPDIGQGGWLIDLIHDERELEDFLTSIKMPFIIQEYISDPIELGLLYYRYPGRSSGTISSLAMKQLLTVTGDGTNTIRDLMKKIPRLKSSFQDFN